MGFLVAPAHAAIHGRGQRALRTGPRRRPRACALGARFTKAVFLPPDQPIPMPGTGDDEDEKPRTKPENGNENAAGVGAGADAGGVVYKPRRDNIDRLLEDTTFEPSTWAAQNEKRTLSMLKGRTQWSVGADELNESLAPDHLARHRHVLAPDEAFGAIFAWHTVVGNARQLELKAWCEVAEKNELIPPDYEDVVRAENMVPEAAVQRVFYWTRDWGTIKRLVHEQRESRAALHELHSYDTAPGLRQWLDLLSKYGVQCVLCAPYPRAMVESVVASLGLNSYFAPGALVTAEDEFDTLEQMMLVAAIKAERPPQKCVAFVDRPAAIAAAHEVSAKVVALVGAYPAYEVKTADASIANYDELVVYNVRRLFSEEGQELMDPLTQLEKPN